MGSGRLVYGVYMINVHVVREWLLAAGSYGLKAPAAGHTPAIDCSVASLCACARANAPN